MDDLTSYRLTVVQTGVDVFDVTLLQDGEAIKYHIAYGVSDALQKASEFADSIPSFDVELDVDINLNIRA